MPNRIAFAFAGIFIAYLHLIMLANLKATFVSAISCVHCIRAAAKPAEGSSGQETECVVHAMELPCYKLAALHQTK